VSGARVALYARVSTSNSQQDPEMQLRELREFAEHRDFSLAGEYVDRMTGSKDSRPALNRLMSDAGRRKFDAVIVWKLDRFGRSLRHLVNAIAELEAIGVAFISFRDNLDLTTPSGRLMFQIIGAMAEFEKALIQERVRAGLRNAKAKGKKLGRPRVEVDVERVDGLRASGASWRTIAAELGIGLGTVHRLAQVRSKIGCVPFPN
jgi:DNA invertase Pin-like site-specific DNA recombinase